MSYEMERRHERYPSSLRMKVRLDNRTYPGRLVNISASGALVRTHATPLLHATLALVVRVPGSDQVIETRGRVVHVIFPAIPGPVAVGVELTSSPPELQTWERVVDHARRASAPRVCEVA